MKKLIALLALVTLAACGPQPKWKIKNVPKIVWVWDPWIVMEASYQGHILTFSALHADFFFVDPGTPNQAYCPVALDITDAPVDPALVNTHLFTATISPNTETFIKTGAIPEICNILDGNYTLTMTNPFVGRIDN